MFKRLKKQIDSNSKYVFELQGKNTGLKNAIEGIQGPSTMSKRTTTNHRFIPVTLINLFNTNNSYVERTASKQPGKRTMGDTNIIGLPSDFKQQQRLIVAEKV